jgi:mRNA-degrading endonuclease RelE of RelBE toxin-antitoxin system
MKLLFRKSFLKDIKRIESKKTKEMILTVIENCRVAENTIDIKNLSALVSNGKFYKIKSGSYRFGLFIDNGTVEFLKFGTRENFYNDFPPY